MRFTAGFSLALPSLRKLSMSASTTCSSTSENLRFGLHRIPMFIGSKSSRSLVEGNVADAAIVQGRLADPDCDVPPVLPAFGGGWNAPLTDFQQRDLGKLLELNHGANFSVPGAGKTRVALAAMQARRDRGQLTRAMVVSPKSAFESWDVETSTCFPGGVVRLLIYDGGVAPDCDLLLVNYERLPDAQAPLTHWLRLQPSLLVLDEAHRMKLGSAGAWGSACLALGPYAASRLILTGTPAPNGARDLENLMAFVWPGQGRAAVAGALAGNDLRIASARLRPLFVRTTKDELGLPPLDARGAADRVAATSPRSLSRAPRSDVGTMARRRKGCGWPREDPPLPAHGSDDPSALSDWREPL